MPAALSAPCTSRWQHARRAQSRPDRVCNRWTRGAPCRALAMGSNGATPAAAASAAGAPVADLEQSSSSDSLPLSGPAQHASSAGNDSNCASPVVAHVDHAVDPAAGSTHVAASAAIPSSTAAAGSELDQRRDAEVAQLREELGELRTLLIAQARLVQSQQRHIQQLEATVAHSIVGPAAAATVSAVGPSSSSGQEARSSSPGRSVLLESVKAEEERARRVLQNLELPDRRLTGLFDARYHSTSWGATPRDHRVLPKRIFLVRHAESEGNVDNIAYTYLPDPRVPLTARGWQQAMQAGERLKAHMEEVSGGNPYKLFFYTSPYLRSRQTYEGLVQAFSPDQVKGVQEEVQLREQDFGNFQDAEGKKREKAERLRFGRFFYRFPNGESGADVYDRMTIFEDHLVRDINAGRFADDSSLVLVTHGLALRIFLMRWFHWTVDQFMSVFNPPNAEPLVLERVPTDSEARRGGPVAWIHTKALYRLSDSSREIIKGCTEEMCQTSWVPRQISPLDPADSMLVK